MSRSIRLIVAVVIACMGLVGVLQHAGAQDGATGTVTILKYYCTYLDSTMQLEAIDANECTPGGATFTFYLQGDGTNDFEQLIVDANGSGSIELPVGSYDVIEEGSQAAFGVSVLEGQSIQLLVGNPAVDAVPTEAPVQTGTVTIQKYYCTYLEETLLVEAIDEAKCVPGSATFSFYMIGDGTNEFQQLTTGANGQGVIELGVGSYEMVEEDSQTVFTINVLADENVQLLIANPGVAVVPTAPASGPAPAPAPTEVPSTSKPPVKLPNTGSGNTSGTGTMAIVMTVAAAATALGAVTVRKVRQI